MLKHALWMLIPSGCALAAQVFVPADLEPWRRWALHGAEQQQCPVLMHDGKASDQDFRCAWPQALNLAVDEHGGHFTQHWEVFAESWVALPGDSEYWPTEVRANGAAVPVVMHEGVPQMQLAAGAYQISGAFSWKRRPAQLSVPEQSGIIFLNVNGVEIHALARTADAVSLGAQATPAVANAVDLKVYRMLEDEIPAQLTTRLQLEVAGEAREVRISSPLPAGFVPMALSGELPARLDGDGGLRLLLRPGRFEVTLTARAAGVANRVARPAHSAPWPAEEIWSFAGVDRLRVAAAEGAEGIDPKQAGVPEEWQQHPAFRIGAGATLQITERSRGLTAADENRLQLVRQLWLDFDHAGLTAVDAISGTMRSEWRLQSAAPFRLASARSGEEDLLVSGLDGQPGVEVRMPELHLTGVSRSGVTRGRMSASGWGTRFESVRGTLNLPPGHRLLAAPGADDAPGTWCSAWTLWSLFGVLIVVVVSHRVAGLTAAGVALFAMLLLYQEAPSYIWLWANALAAIAAARSGAAGRWPQWTKRYRALSLGALALALLPLLWTQMRLAIYPQLEAAMPVPMGLEVRFDRPPHPAAPPPPEAMLGNVGSVAARAMLSEVVVTGAREKDKAEPASTPIARYAPGTQLQAGPGVPVWEYNSYQFSWTGPVEPGETVRFVYIGPVLLALWRVLGVFFTGLWFAWLLQAGFGLDLRLPQLPWRTLRGGTGRTVALLLGLAVIGGLPQRAAAAATPDPVLLQELRARLLAPPTCRPNCSEVDAARVAVDGDRLELVLQLAALADVAVPIPDAGNRWQIDSLSLDGNAAVSVSRENDATLWVPLRAGAHTLRLVARLTTADQVSVAFPQPPRHIDVVATGWDVAGLHDSHLVAGALELSRHRSSAGPAAQGFEGTQFPAFVRVSRDVKLDLDWSIATTVERLAPETAAITTSLPLLPGEVVLTPGLQVSGTGAGARLTVGIAAGSSAVVWNSSLPQSTELVLASGADAARVEEWNFTVSPQWTVQFEGFPAVLPESIGDGDWIFQYRPRPGEQLKVRIARPAPVAGTTLAIDSVKRQINFGARTVDESLEISYRSTQGGRHSITLPPDAHVQAVHIDGEPVALRPEAGELSIGLLPGTHVVIVEWRRAQSPGLRARAGAVDLRADASNIRTTLVLPRERWPLFVSRALAGPVVRYWGELLVFVLSALLLARVPRSPLAAHEWLLLGLGLSTQSWAVFALMAVWFFVMRWRAQWRTESVSRPVFNLVQIALVLFTVSAIGSLLFSGIRFGFLSAPDMGIAGAGSSDNSFLWFHDLAHGPLPEVRVWSVPLWTYKLLMFAWATWIAFALTGWLRWAWGAWSRGGPRPDEAELPAQESAPIQE